MECAKIEIYDFGGKRKAVLSQIKGNYLGQRLASYLLIY